MAQVSTVKHSSALEPLKSPTYRSFWTAAVVTNTGLFMQDVGASWLMTSLSTDPFMIALMQTAQTLPAFILALPFGALADVLDRRKLLLFGQFWMMTAAVSLAVLTLTGHITPWFLLGLTFMLFVGSAAGAPAWSAMTPDIVPRKHLESAIGLGSAGYNIARGLGSALGGVIVGAFGPGWVFLANATCYTAMINALVRWNVKANPRKRSTEKITGAIRAGVRYTRHSQALRAILMRTVVFATAASALWSLLPLLAREQLHLNSMQYGIMVSSFGIGTFLGALILPRMRRRLTLDLMSAVGTILFAGSLAVVACSHIFISGCIGMLGCGIAWTIKNSSLNVAVQFAAPNWVRARAYSIYLLVFQGCTAVGAMIWGAIARSHSMTEAMLCAAVMLLVGLLASYWFKLAHAENLDLVESTHWQDPELTHEIPAFEDGPCMVTVQYVIDPDCAKDFMEAMKALEIQRRRDGAFQWYVFRDLADESKFCETFLVDTWGEHMRQHQRVTMNDRAAEQRVDSFHIDGRPIVNHYIAASAQSPAHTHTHETT